MDGGTDHWHPYLTHQPRNTDDNKAPLQPFPFKIKGRLSGEVVSSLCTILETNTHMGGEEEKEERGLGFPGPNAPDEWGGCYMYYTSPQRVSVHILSHGLRIDKTTQYTRERGLGNWAYCIALY